MSDHKIEKDVLINNLFGILEGNKEKEMEREVDQTLSQLRNLLPPHQKGKERELYAKLVAVRDIVLEIGGPL